MRPRSLALLAAFVVAGATAQTSNGCGSGWNVYLVPDSLPLAGCVFRPSCDRHDACYGACEKAVIADDDATCAYRRCRSGGALFGAAICETFFYEDSERQAQQRKQRCDRDFYADLRGLNRGLTVCEAFALLYTRAVEMFGQSAFRGVAPPGGKPGELPFTEESRRAISDFFAQADEQQLQQLIRDLERPQPVLDPTQPLVFEPGRGLRNDVAR